MATWLTNGLTWAGFAVLIAWSVVFLLVVLFFVTYAIYYERKVIGWCNAIY